ncbi:MAG: DUF1285 domain-containing protein [Alphaproteobacteria bacterium]
MTSKSDQSWPLPTAEDEAYPIEIKADGTWFHDGRPIRRDGLVRLFSTVLRRDEAGDYWLKTPVEQGRIRVEDAPLLATAVKRDEAGALVFTLNVGREVVAGADLPIIQHPRPIAGAGQEPAPYLLLPHNVEALILRPVWLDLLAMAEVEDGRAVLTSGQARFDLGAVDLDGREGQP